ncbi:hypothetical protein K0504_01265 [Neiella marina]|uniref:Uncharacterized protein n=1 Tax=Neiella holothuriorum TaxID=2870530 RepID=A0ABS7EBP4_9GAMM|nr:hypothetical protein [Neiella holothuriorum]MBW8189650.1 hypothetical protein [Neiella holothuriorum]
MKHTLFVMTALLSVAALAAGPAPKDVYEETVELCNEWAKDDGIPATEVKAYVEKCVQQDLEDMGYTLENPADATDALALKKGDE